MREGAGKKRAEERKKWTLGKDRDDYIKHSMFVTRCLHMPY